LSASGSRYSVDSTNGSRVVVGKLNSDSIRDLIASST